VGAFFASIAVKLDQLISQNVAIGRNPSFFDDRVVGIVLLTGDKIDLGICPVKAAYI